MGALGLTMVVLRIGCIILFSVVSHDQAVSFLRTLLCGVDVSPILLSEGMTVQDIIFSLIQVFVYSHDTFFSSKKRRSLRNTVLLHFEVADVRAILSNLDTCRQTGT